MTTTKQPLPIRSRIIPPLRLILTSKCNGYCEYCHHEGYAKNAIFMSRSAVLECAKIANELMIPTISFTGGEPTLYADLPTLIMDVQKVYKGNIGITTNGYQLDDICNISTPIHMINLSLSSFNIDVYKRYQNVNPTTALKSLERFPAEHKKLNIVVTADNYIEIDKIIDYCVTKYISIDVMFELKEYSNKDIEMQKYIFSMVSIYGESFIQFGVTSTIIIKVNDKCIISLKHPVLSRMLKRHVCSICEFSSECYERICAVRVHPDNLVTACLNKKYSFSEGKISDRIKTAYSLFHNDCESLESLLC